MSPHEESQDLQVLRVPQEPLPQTRKVPTWQQLASLCGIKTLAAKDHIVDATERNRALNGNSLAEPTAPSRKEKGRLTNDKDKQSLSLKRVTKKTAVKSKPKKESRGKKANSSSSEKPTSASNSILAASRKTNHAAAASTTRISSSSDDDNDLHQQATSNSQACDHNDDDTNSNDLMIENTGSIRQTIQQARREYRLLEHGCIAPKRPTAQLDDGTFARPRGKQFAGFYWDEHRAHWVPYVNTLKIINQEMTLNDLMKKDRILKQELTLNASINKDRHNKAVKQQGERLRLMTTGSRSARKTPVQTQSQHGPAIIRRESLQQLWSLEYVDNLSSTAVTRNSENGNKTKKDISSSSFLQYSTPAVGASDYSPMKQTRRDEPPLKLPRWDNRRLPNGSLLPKHSPTRLGDGTYSQPRGRAPEGFQWDKVRAQWKPETVVSSKHEQKEGARGSKTLTGLTFKSPVRAIKQQSSQTLGRSTQKHDSVLEGHAWANLSAHKNVAAADSTVESIASLSDEGDLMERENERELRVFVTDELAQNVQVARLENRLLTDCSIVPKSPARRNDNGTYARPIGRQLTGFHWNDRAGTWKPDLTTQRLLKDESSAPPTLGGTGRNDAQGRVVVAASDGQGSSKSRSSSSSSSPSTDEGESSGDQYMASRKRPRSAIQQTDIHQAKRFCGPVSAAVSVRDDAASPNTSNTTKILKQAHKRGLVRPPGRSRQGCRWNDEKGRWELVKAVMPTILGAFEEKPTISHAHYPGPTKSTLASDPVRQGRRAVTNELILDAPGRPKTPSNASAMRVNRRASKDLSADQIRPTSPLIQSMPEKSPVGWLGSSKKTPSPTTERLRVSRLASTPAYDDASSKNGRSRQIKEHCVMGKRGRGRPRKSPAPVESFDSPTLAKTKALQHVVSLNRDPGLLSKRSKVTPAPVESLGSVGYTKAQALHDTSLKRGPGRPRKRPASEEMPVGWLGRPKQTTAPQERLNASTEALRGSSLDKGPGPTKGHVNTTPKRGPGRPKKRPELDEALTSESGMVGKMSSSWEPRHSNPIISHNEIPTSEHMWATKKVITKSFSQTRSMLGLPQPQQYNDFIGTEAKKIRNRYLPCERCIGCRMTENCSRCLPCMLRISGTTDSGSTLCYKRICIEPVLGTIEMSEPCSEILHDYYEDCLSETKSLSDASELPEDFGQ
jgi:hypothetical protein